MYWTNKTCVLGLSMGNVGIYFASQFNDHLRRLTANLVKILVVVMSSKATITVVRIMCWASIHWADGRLTVRSDEVSGPQDSSLNFNHSEVWQAPWQQYCRVACQISERHNHYNIRAHGFETLRGLVVRRVTVLYIKVLGLTLTYHTIFSQGCNPLSSMICIKETFEYHYLKDKARSQMESCWQIRELKK